MRLGRRHLLAGLTPLAAPALGQGVGGAAPPLRFVPQADATILDPIVTTAYVTRNHAYLVWDTLYGLDADWRPQPQMVEGHLEEEGGRRVTLRLREGLRFHDGTPVRAVDCVASVRRWAMRDPLGQTLLALTEELAALDDRSFRFRLRRPFPLLFEALAKPAVPVCFIMPERLATQDPSRPFRGELIGSGPFRFLADERVPGARLAYARFDGYLPRAEGTPGWTAGPKRAHLDRIEWHVTPDAATTAAALQAGEVDWWEQPTADMQPLLRRNRNIVLDIPDPTGLMAVCRLNHLHPPFDNPAMRRALLGALSQADFMTAVMGIDRSLWREGVGFFPPGTPMASDAGMEVLTAARDLDRARREIQAAGYRGERVTLIAASDFPSLNAMSQVGNDLFRRLGFNMDYVATDWGSVVQRRASREPPERGGWSLFFTFAAGLDFFHPGGHTLLRGQGDAGWFGWPRIPRLEALREEWFVAADLPAQQVVARQMQAVAFEEVPYLPLGQYFQATAWRRGLVGVLKGPPLFWNVRRG
jgi:peptide/nickel transport system substrate-binding protein